MKACTVLLLVLALVLCTVSCGNDNVVLDHTEGYSLIGNVHSLNISVNAAAVTIKHGEEFYVESNLKDLTVLEKDGVLNIKNNVKNASLGINETNAEIVLYVPENTVFADITISVGAIKLTSVALNGKNVKLDLGAGSVEIEEINASVSAHIVGGTGNVTVKGGSINSLNLEMGVGTLDLTAALMGRSELVLGVGNSDITLSGSESEYAVCVEKGIGSVSYTGTVLPDLNGVADGINAVSVKGGIGSINISHRYGKS